MRCVVGVSAGIPARRRGEHAGAFSLDVPHDGDGSKAVAHEPADTTLTAHSAERQLSQRVFRERHNEPSRDCQGAVFARETAPLPNGRGSERDFLDTFSGSKRHRQGAAVVSRRQ